jgi:hypothetical protein
MIYKIVCEDRTEYAQAKDLLHLLKSYDEEFEGIQDITEVVEISEDEAKTIMLSNPDYDEDNPGDEPKEFSLFDTVVGDDFQIVGSTEWV